MAACSQQSHPVLDGPHVDEDVRREAHEAGRFTTGRANALAAEMLEGLPEFFDFTRRRATPGAALAAMLFMSRVRRPQAPARCRCEACRGDAGGSRVPGGGGLSGLLLAAATAAWTAGTRLVGQGAGPRAAAHPPGAELQAGASSSVRSACSVCGEEELPAVRMMVCSRCREPGLLYCSQACQRESWKTHKADCRAAGE